MSWKEKSMFKENKKLREESKILRVYNYYNVSIPIIFFLIIIFIVLLSFYDNLKFIILFFIILLVSLIISFFIFKTFFFNNKVWRFVIKISTGKDSLVKAMRDKNFIKKQIITIIISMSIYFFLIFIFWDSFISFLGKKIFIILLVIVAGLHGLINLIFYVLRYIELTKINPKKKK